MRRLWSILLLLLFSFSLISPALAAYDDSNLPACCRREGRHHCALPGGKAHLPDGFQATNRCPMPAGISLSQIADGAAVLPPAVSLAAPCAVLTSVAAVAPVRVSNAFIAANTQRGPPSLPTLS